MRLSFFAVMTVLCLVGLHAQDPAKPNAASKPADGKATVKPPADTTGNPYDSLFSEWREILKSGGSAGGPAGGMGPGSMMMGRVSRGPSGGGDLAAPGLPSGFAAGGGGAEGGSSGGVGGAMGGYGGVDFEDAEPYVGGGFTRYGEGDTSDDYFRENLRSAMNAFRATESTEERAKISAAVRSALQAKYQMTLAQRDQELKTIEARVAALRSELELKRTSMEKVLDVQLQTFVLAGEGLMELPKP